MSDPMRTEKLSPKLARRCGFRDVQTLAHWCPACNEMHDFATVKPFANGARWTWNQDVERPSMSPSMKIEWKHADEEIERCHYFLTDGRISYCGDSTHKLSGQTVDLPDIPREVWLRAGIQA